MPMDLVDKSYIFILFTLVCELSLGCNGCLTSIMTLFQEMASRLLVNELTEQPRLAEISLEDTNDVNLVRFQAYQMSDYHLYEALFSNNLARMSHGAFAAVKIKGNDMFVSTT